MAAKKGDKEKTKEQPADGALAITIRPPNFKIVKLRVEGTTPLMMHKFSEKMRKKIEEAQTSKNKTKRAREPKDYEAEFNGARYISGKGWDGIPAGSFRAAMIAACRYVDGLTMTAAKGLFFIIADGSDDDGTSLVKIIGKPVHDTRPVRNDGGGTDMRNRPRYYPWAVELAIKYDADLISAQDVVSLLARAGSQVGIGEYRPQARKGVGGDFGMFEVVSSKE